MNFPARMDPRYARKSVTMRNMLQGACVCVIGDVETHMDYLCRRLEQDSPVEICRLNNLSEFLSVLAHREVLATFIDAEFVGTISDALDICEQLRGISPKNAIVLCSRNVRESDFTTERHPICDVTLRIPFFRAEVEQGMRCAIENNVWYQNKISSQRNAARAEAVVVASRANAIDSV